MHTSILPSPGPKYISASPILGGNGRIYFANAGKSFVIRNGQQFELLAVSDLGDGSMFLVRMKNVYCVRNK